MITIFEKFEDWYYDYQPYEWEKLNDDRGQMWKIPLKKPDFYICLDKVEMPKDQQTFWKRSLDNGMFVKDINRKIDDSITHMILQRSFTGYFTWSRCDKYWTDGDNASYRYMGEMKVTPEEIDEYNYQIEMEKDAKKYNL